MVSKHTSRRVRRQAVVVCVALFGSCLLALSFLPLAALCVATRLAGIALLIIALPLYLGGRYIERSGSDILGSFSRFFGTLSSFVREAWRTDGRAHTCALLLIVLGAIVLRLQFLSQPMRHDEAYTFSQYASKPLSQALSNYSFPNNHLFHTFQVHIAYSLFGNKPWVVRLPAFLAGVLVIPASYLALRSLYGKNAGLLTAAIAASSSLLIEFSTNARGYSIVCLVFMLLLSLAAYLKRTQEPAAWLLFSVLAALGLYTIPIMVYPLGIVVMWLFLSAVFRDTSVGRTQLLKNLVLSLLVIALLTSILYLPVLVVSGWRRLIVNRAVTPRLWADFAERLPVAFHLAWTRWNTDIPIVLRVLLVIGFGATLVFHHRWGRGRVPVVAAIFAWCIPVLIVQRIVPKVAYGVFLLPLYIGLASAGLTGLLSLVWAYGRGYKNVLFTVLVLAISAWIGINVIVSQSVPSSTQTATIRHAKEIAIFLKQYLRPGDRVLIFGFHITPVKYYFDVYDVPQACLRTKLSSSHRILAIVSKSSNQTLAEVLARYKLSDVDLGVPRIVADYESATVYEMRGLGGTEQRSSQPSMGRLRIATAPAPALLPANSLFLVRPVLRARCVRR